MEQMNGRSFIIYSLKLKAHHRTMESDETRNTVTALDGAQQTLREEHMARLDFAQAGTVPRVQDVGAQANRSGSGRSW